MKKTLPTATNENVLQLTRDDKFLRQPTIPVTEFTAELLELTDELVAACLFYGGVGIAANQVGLPFRVCVINHKLTDPFVMVNPHVVEESGSRVVGEGCLSFPGRTGLVQRAKRVSVVYYTPRGKRQKLRDAEGRLSHVLQHECDHLDGVVYVDKLFDPRSLEERLSEDHGLVIPG